MELSKYIFVIDNFLPKEANESFIEVCKSGYLKFEEATVVRDGKNEKDLYMRKTEYCSLKNFPEFNMTTKHWANYFYREFTNAIIKYNNDLNTLIDAQVKDIQVLKYEIGGHYRFHWDDGPTTPRTLSGIYFVNDNYEGGDLEFKFWKSDKRIKIKKEKNLFVMWPSNFLYPHTVQNVTKGTRYSVVTWAR